ncbi:hypothetical protein B9J78_01295 [bacterium Unc6]|nr:hypothetical protein [bacterium Unc6]
MNGDNLKNMYLNKILENKKIEIEKAKNIVSLNSIIKRCKKVNFKTKSLCTAINKSHHISLIAEIKRKSPSKGILVGRLNPVVLAQIYEASGASAISVLTDTEFFGGSLKDLEDVKKTVHIPVLRKEFIIDKYQIYQSYASGADAVLLIAGILTLKELENFSHLSHSLGMQVLCEVHTEEELKCVLDCKEKINIIGINNRNLETLDLNLNTTEQIIKHIPKDRVVVSESGIKNYEDVLHLQSLGVQAILVGETLITAEDVQLKIKELLGNE